MTNKYENKLGSSKKFLDQDQSLLTTAAFPKQKYPAEFKTASDFKADSSPDGAHHPCNTLCFVRFPALTEGPWDYFQRETQRPQGLGVVCDPCTGELWAGLPSTTGSPFCLLSFYKGQQEESFTCQLCLQLR